MKWKPAQGILNGYHYKRHNVSIALTSDFLLNVYKNSVNISFMFPCIFVLLLLFNNISGTWKWKMFYYWNGFCLSFLYTHIFLLLQYFFKSAKHLAIILLGLFRGQEELWRTCLERYKELQHKYFKSNAYVSFET